MSIVTTREQRRQLARDNAKMPAQLQIVPVDQWPAVPHHPSLVRVWRSRNFLVQEYMSGAPILARLSINRTTIGGDRWTEDISWDELQQIKRECGYGDLDAVEVYPTDRDVVNVANMRHLWIVTQPLTFAWRAL